MTRNQWGIVASLTVVCLCTMLVAQPVLCNPREHDGGFFLRLSAGGGAAGTEKTADSLKMKFSGGAADVNLAIGGIISPNLALHGTIYGWVVSDPEVEVEGTGVGNLPADLSLSAVGAGLTYYFMPANLYLSASAGIGSMTIKLGSVSVESESGLVLDFTLGKEWWVGDSWGLGIAVGVSHHSIPEKDVDENWSGTSFGIRFSATRN